MNDNVIFHSERRGYKSALRTIQIVFFIFLAFLLVPVIPAIASFGLKFRSIRDVFFVCNCVFFLLVLVYHIPLLLSFFADLDKSEMFLCMFALCFPGAGVIVELALASTYEESFLALATHGVFLSASLFFFFWFCRNVARKTECPRFLTQVRRTGKAVALIHVMSLGLWLMILWSGNKWFPEENIPQIVLASTALLAIGIVYVKVLMMLSVGKRELGEYVKTAYIDSAKSA